MGILVKWSKFSMIGKIRPLAAGVIIIFICAFSEVPLDTEPKQPDQIIKLRLEESGTAFTARIISLEQAAETIGLDKLKIKGVVIKEPNPDNKLTKYTISWGTATLNDKSAILEKPFFSSLLVDGELDKDASFNAKGDIEALLRAFRQLQASGDEASKSSETALANLNPSAGTPANTPVATKNPELAPVVPNVAVAKDPFIFVTSEGCEIKVDPAQGVAVMQERVLTDGKETSACGDSLTKYPLTRVYNGCPVLEDPAKFIAYEQYTLGYTDPKTGGRVEVNGCALDEDKSMAIIEQADGCPDAIGDNGVSAQSKLAYNYKGIEKLVRDCAPTGESYPLIKLIDACTIRHDFAAGKSYQQKKQAYNKAGQVIVLAGSICQDDPQDTYMHESTRDGCAPVRGGSTVIFSTRKYITLAGKRSYISECVPEASGVTVQEEPCTSPKYTNDFTAGQSYLNKNYFYMDGATRVEVATCAQSEQTFTHYKDMAGCTATNDDIAKTSQLYSKTFITSDNVPNGTNKTYLTQCQQEGQPVPYATNGSKWRVIGAKTVSINVNQIPITAYAGTIWGSVKAPALTVQYGWTQQTIWDGRYYWDCSPKNTYCVMHSYTDAYFLSLSSNGEYCLRESLNTPWVTSGGLTIDSANSDAFPVWDFDQATKNWLQPYQSMDPSLNPPNPLYASWSAPGGAYNCTTPSCTMSTLSKYSAYTRSDGSLYVDMSVPIETKNVCGSGSKLVN